MTPETAASPSRWWRLFPLVRHLSDRLTPVLLRLPVTPNQVTAASLACGIAGDVLFAVGGHGNTIIGALLMISCYVLDNCDGDIARAKKLFSRFGHYFDSVTDWLVDTTFFACLGFGQAAERGESLWMWLGIIAAAGATLSYFLELIHDLRRAQGRVDPEKLAAEAAVAGTLPRNLTEGIIYIFRELTRADFCFIVLLLAYYDVAWVLLPLAAIGSQVYWMTSLIVGWRRFHV